MSKHTSSVTGGRGNVRPNERMADPKGEQRWMLYLKAAGGIPVGIAPNSQFASRTCQLETNDVVVAYTDGITEAQNVDGDFCGQQKREELLLASRHKAPQQIIDDILNKLTEFVNGHPQRDDMTLVVMRVQGGDARLWNGAASLSQILHRSGGAPLRLLLDIEAGQYVTSAAHALGGFEENWRN